MPTCPRCGAQCEREDRYCGKCGQRLFATITKGKATQEAIRVAKVRYKLGLIYYKKGELLDAIEIWQRALEDDPENLAIKLLIERAQEEQRSERNLP
ncbi:MAG: tetratricopeptide repeat protein [Candidatus Latescibacteria bacterium]|nr:tetratricopeptide repeat protein [Candidatus Latescibacterota bacterium]